MCPCGVTCQPTDCNLSELEQSKSSLVQCEHHYHLINVTCSRHEKRKNCSSGAKQQSLTLVWKKHSEKSSEMPKVTDILDRLMLYHMQWVVSTGPCKFNHMYHTIEATSRLSLFGTFHDIVLLCYVTLE